MNGALPSSCGTVRGFLCVKLYSQKPCFSPGRLRGDIHNRAWLHIVTSAAILHTSRAGTLRCFFSDGPTHARHEEHCSVYVVALNVHRLFLHISTCQVSPCTVRAEGRVQTVTRWWLMGTEPKTGLWNAAWLEKENVSTAQFVAVEIMAWLLLILIAGGAYYQLYILLSYNFGEFICIHFLKQHDVETDILSSLGRNTSVVNTNPRSRTFARHIDRC